MIFTKPYQPVKFIEGDYIGYSAEQEECNQCFAPPFCQMVEPEDETKFQVGICDFDEETELVQYGDFSEVGTWVAGGDWEIDTGTPNAIIEAGAGGTLSQEVDITAGYTYIIRFWNLFSDNGSGDSLFVYLGGTEVIEIIEDGTHDSDRIITVTLDDPLTDSLLRFVADSGIDAEIFDVSIIEAPCVIRQLVSNRTFENNSDWNFGTDWIFSQPDCNIPDRDSGMAHKNSGSAGVLSTTVDIQAGCYYKLQYKICDNSIEPDTDQIDIKLGGNIIHTILYTEAVGVHTVYAYITNTINNLLEFDSTDEVDFDIDDILLWELSSLGYDVKDENDVSVFAGTGVYADTVAQGEIDWAGIIEGCYNICVYDLCVFRANIIVNGTFGAVSFWNLSGPWTISGGNANVNSSAGGTIDQDITLVAKTLYRLKYEITSWSNIGTASISVQLNDQTVQTISSAGDNLGEYSHLVLIDTVVNDKVEFVLNADGNNVVAVLDDVELEQLTGCESAQLVTNGDFAIDESWNFTGGWAISGGNANNTVPVGSIDQSIPLSPNTEYTLTFDVIIIQNKTLTVTYNGTAILIVNTSGSKTVTFTTGGTISDPLLTFSDVIDVVNGNAIQIDNVVLTQEDCGGEFCSECFDLKEDHKCAVLTEWTGPKNAFGFNYEDLDFTQSLRIEAKLRRPTMPQDFNIQNTESDGNVNQVAIRTRIQQQLAVSQVPEYIHEALEIGTNHKEFFIDNVAYIRIPGDYAPNWRDRSLVAPVVLDVQKKSQPNREMVNC